jgi:hypothetical protein
MGWVIAVLVAAVVVAAIVAIEVRGKRKRAMGRRRLEAGADPERDGKHPSYGAWMGGMGGSGGSGGS